MQKQSVLETKAVSLLFEFDILKTPFIMFTVSQDLLANHWMSAHSCLMSQHWLLNTITCTQNVHMNEFCHIHIENETCILKSNSKYNHISFWIRHIRSHLDTCWNNNIVIAQGRKLSCFSKSKPVTEFETFIFGS